MSKSKTYKSKKGGANIFVILIVALVVLVVAIVVVNSVQSGKINKLIGDYTEQVYGEREKVKMTYVGGNGYDIWQSEKYVYDVANDVIYDYAYNSEKAEEFSTKVNELVSAWGEEYSAANIMYTRYTDGSDVTKNYDELVIYSLSDKVGTVESTDAAAEMVWKLVGELGEDYNFAGVIVSVFDKTNEYSVVVDTLEKQPLTLEALKANTVKVEEHTSIYNSWLAALEAAEDTATEENVSEGDVSEGTVEKTSEE